MARDRTYKFFRKFKKYKTTQDEIDIIRHEAKESDKLLKNKYLMEYFSKAKEEILNIHAKQLLCDSKEIKEKNGVKKVMEFKASKEYAMLAGQYRFIEQLIADFEQNIKIAEDMDDKIKSELIEVVE